MCSAARCTRRMRYEHRELHASHSPLLARISPRFGAAFTRVIEDPGPTNSPILPRTPVGQAPGRLTASVTAAAGTAAERGDRPVHIPLDPTLRDQRVAQRQLTVPCSDLTRSQHEKLNALSEETVCPLPACGAGVAGG
jgi:hypothetical protein